MARFIEGADRGQSLLLPECLDDYVGDDSPVRAVDAFVEMLDLCALGFAVVPEATGRAGYHPGMMLRLCIYGYLNQIQSSRRLERECGRNLELIWLTGRLKPDFKTIADFQRYNVSAIRKACREFVALCRGLSLLDSDLVAIDGSRFKAVNAKAKSFTREKLRRKLGEIDAAIEKYLAEVDRADEALDKRGWTVPTERLNRTVRKLAHLKKEADKLRAVERRMDETGETQVSLSDPERKPILSNWKARHGDHGPLTRRGGRQAGEEEVQVVPDRLLPHSLPDRRLPANAVGDIAEVQTAEGKLCLFVAVDRTSKFTYAELHEKAGKMIATQFLRFMVAVPPLNALDFG